METNESNADTVRASQISNLEWVLNYQKEQAGIKTKLPSWMQEENFLPERKKPDTHAANIAEDQYSDEIFAQIYQQKPYRKGSPACMIQGPFGTFTLPWKGCRIRCRNNTIIIDGHVQVQGGAQLAYGGLADGCVIPKGQDVIFDPPTIWNMEWFETGFFEDKRYENRDYFNR